MNSPECCPRCGAPLSHPGADCARCLLGLGLGEETDAVTADTLFAGLDLPPSDAPLVIADKYHLVRLIGRGGMGVVYLASQENLARPVALKMLHASVDATPALRARFLSEAKAVACLLHPNIVTLFDWGEHEGRPYFSMEYVAGMSLSQAIRDRPLPPERAAELLEVVARAVHFAHTRGFIHRDLKPSNILLDGAGKPKITDFGLAKNLGGTSDLTMSGAALGTPSYMAPEQARGDGAQEGPGNDVYSLGAVLYHLLVGRPPFIASSLPEIQRQVLHDDPIALRRLSPAIPRDLETICLKCLEKEPHRRYISAEEFAGDLQAFRDRRPIRARPVGRIERIVKWCRREPRVAGLSLAFSTVFAAGFTVAVWQWQRAETNRAVNAEMAVQGQRRAGEALFEMGRSGEGLSMLAGLLRSDPMNRPSALRLASALTWSSPALPVTPPMQGATLLAIPSPGGERVASLDSSQRTLRLWNVPDVRPIAAIALPGTAVQLDFDRDGGRVVAGIALKGLYTWDAHTGAPAYPTVPAFGLLQFVTLPDRSGFLVGLANGHVAHYSRTNAELQVEWVAHQRPVTYLEISEDGRFLVSSASAVSSVSSNREQVARVWDWKSPSRLVLSVTNAGHTTQTRLSPDGERLVTGQAPRTVRLWALPAGRVLGDIPLPDESEDVVFSPDSARLAIGTEAGVVVVDARTGRSLYTHSGQRGRMYGVCFSPDGLQGASAAQDGSVHVWDSETGKSTVEPILLGYSASSVAFSGTGGQLLATELHGYSRLFDVRDGAAPGWRLETGAPVHNAAFLPNGSGIVTVSSATGEVDVWDVGNGERRRQLRPAGPGLERSVFDPAGQHLLLADTNHLVTALELESGRSAVASLPTTHAVRTARFEPIAGRWAVIAGSELFVIDGRTGELLATRGCDKPSNYGHLLESVCWDPLGRRILAGCNDMHARLWDGESFAVLADFPHAANVHDVAFSPDGRRVVTASADRKARVWLLSHLSRPQITLQHPDEVIRCGFSADGATIVTSSTDQSVALWDARTGRRLSAPMPYPGGIVSAQADPLWSQLGTLTDRGVLRLWELQTGMPLTQPLSIPDFLDAEGRPRLGASQDWQFLVAACQTNRVLVIGNQALPRPVPDWFPTLAESLTAPDWESASYKAAPSFPQIRERLLASTDQDPWTRWGRWFCADRGTRNQVWWSDRPMQELVDRALASGDVTSLRRVLRFQPTNWLALAHLSRALLVLPDDPLRRVQARFLARRAAENAPGSEPILQLRREVEARLGALPAE